MNDKAEAINQKIVERFFRAFGYLKTSGDLRGIKTFTDRYGINRKSIYCVKDGTMNNLPSSWLAFLAQDYGVSASWLLTGEGPFWVENRKKTANKENVKDL